MSARIDSEFMTADVAGHVVRYVVQYVARKALAAGEGAC